LDRRTFVIIVAARPGSWRLRTDPSWATGPWFWRRGEPGRPGPGPTPTRASTSTWAATGSHEGGEVNKLWRECSRRLPATPAAVADLLQEEVLPLPLKALDALRVSAFSSPCSSCELRALEAVPTARETFEQWVTTGLGSGSSRPSSRRIRESMGISCSELKANGRRSASETSRSRGAREALPEARKTIRTLVGEFDYPAWVGMMWRASRTASRSSGAGACASRAMSSASTGTRASSRASASATRTRGVSTERISSRACPSRSSSRSSTPAAAARPEAASRLAYLTFLNGLPHRQQAHLFPTTGSTSTSRTSRSRHPELQELVPRWFRSQKTSLGLSISQRGDSTWPRRRRPRGAGPRRDRPDRLAKYEDVETAASSACEAYPVYASEYREHLAVIREFMDGLHELPDRRKERPPPLQNQDHSMLTGCTRPQPALR